MCEVVSVWVTCVSWPEVQVKSVVRPGSAICVGWRSVECHVIFTVRAMPVPKPLMICVGKPRASRVYLVTRPSSSVVVSTNFVELFTVSVNVLAGQLVLATPFFDVM